jgi:hypothetical protein
MTDKLTTLIQSIEGILSELYGFLPQISAVDHLVSSEEMRQDSSLEIDTNLRGQVLIQHSHHEEATCYIGVCLRDDVIHAISQPSMINPPLLDAWMVLVEEISHFHLILNRVHRKLSTRPIELEYQAELDKVLVTAQLLESSLGDPYYKSLLRLSQQGILTSEESHYGTAASLALRTLGRFDLHNRQALNWQDRQTLRRLYYTDFDGKMHLMFHIAA